MILTLLGVALVVVRTVQAARQRSWRVISERHSLLYAWALSATVFFAAMQLRLPHYFALVVVPMYCYLAAEAKTFAEARQRHGQQFGGGQRMAMVALLLAFVGINLAASGVRLYGNGGNAIARTVAWTDAHLQPGTRVITEEPVGVAIHQPYCKIWRATICAHDGAKIIITYTSWTQHLPDDPALRALLANSEPVFTTAGFKERITVWRIDPALANGP